MLLDWAGVFDAHRKDRGAAASTYGVRVQTACTLWDKSSHSDDDSRDASNTIREGLQIFSKLRRGGQQLQEALDIFPGWTAEDTAVMFSNLHITVSVYWRSIRALTIHSTALSSLH